MEPPESLPARLYLLAYDREKVKLVRTNLGLALRAAALADLELSGQLRADGRTAVATGLSAPADPVLSGVYAEISASRPRQWQHWVGRGAREIEAAVRGQLADGGWISADRHRVLGLFPTWDIVPRDAQLPDRLRQAVLGAVAGAPADAHTAALAAIAAAGEMPVLPRATRRQHKEHIKTLTERSGAAGPALRRVLKQKRNTTAAAGAAAASGG